MNSIGLEWELLFASASSSSSRGRLWACACDALSFVRIFNVVPFIWLLEGLPIHQALLVVFRHGSDQTFSGNGCLMACDSPSCEDAARTAEHYTEALLSSMLCDPLQRLLEREGMSTLP